MSLASKAARSLSLTAAGHALQFVLQFGSAAVLGRILLDSDYGAYYMATAVVGVAAMFRDFGISQATIRREHVSDDEYARLFWTSAAISLACGAAVALVSPFADAIFDDAALPPIVLALAIPTFVGGLATMPNVRLAREHRFRELAVYNLLAVVGGIVAAVALALAGAGIWALVAQMCASTLTQLACLWLAAPVPIRARNRVDIRPILRHGAWLAASEAIWLGEDNLRRGVLGRLLGGAGLGQMQRPKDLLETPIRLFNSAATSVSLPLLSSVQTDRERLRQSTVEIGEACELMLAIPVALLIACSQDAFLLLLGPRWLEAAELCVWLAMSSVGIGGLQITHWILVLSGAGRRQVALQGFSSCCLFASAVAGALLGGTAGAVIGLLAGHFTAHLVKVCLVFPIAGIRIAPWLGRHLPLWLLQVGAGLLGHLVARRSGDHGSLTAIAAGGACAFAAIAIVLLAVGSWRRRLATGVAALLRRSPPA